MSYAKKLLITLTCSLALLLGCGFTFAAAKSENKNDNKSYVFIQMARKAELTATQQPGVYQLVLSNVKPDITYFTDRPNRTTGSVPIEKFFNGWKSSDGDSFNKDMPNVGITGVQLHGLMRPENVSFVLALQNPQYDAKKRMLTYTAHSLSGGKNAPLPKSITLHDIAIFIDGINACYGCSGMCF